MTALRHLAAAIVLAYIRFWAQLALAIHRPVVIGIAGSVGKSSTKEALVALFHDIAPARATYGNSQTGVPLGILGFGALDYSPLGWLRTLLMCPLKLTATRGISYLIVEMGTDSLSPPDNMDTLLAIVQPDVALFLNTYPVHTQQFAAALDILPDHERAALSEEGRLDLTLRAMAHEDGKIITASRCHTGIYSGDNRYVSDEILDWSAGSATTKLLTFGTSAEATIRLTGHAVSLTGTTFTFQRGGKTLEVALADVALAREYGEVCAAALLTAQALDIPLTSAIASLATNFRLPKSRSSLLAGVNGTTIIDTAYNASPPAVLSALGLLDCLAAATQRPTALILGDMRELGDEAEREHLRVAEALIGRVALLALVGPLTQRYVIPYLQTRGNPIPTVLWYPTARDAAAYLKDHLPANALLLVKGSEGGIYLEEAIKGLLADPADTVKLCRQEPFWLARKRRAGLLYE